MSTENQKRYVQISKTINKIMLSYVDCLNKIQDKEFNKENIEACLGENGLFLANDIEFEKSKMQNELEKQVRSIIQTNCYEVFAGDQANAETCQTLETDAIHLLWQGMNLKEVLQYNNEKY